MKKGRSLNIFIVDDDAMYTRSLEQYLCAEFKEARVTSFPTGEACLHSIHLDPDLIILDYLLNSEFPYAWSGLDVAKRINRISPYTPIVMVSSQKNIDTVLETFKEGVMEYVVKDNTAFEKIKVAVNNVKDNLTEEELAKKDGANVFSIALLVIMFLVFISIFMFN